MEGDLFITFDQLIKIRETYLIKNTIVPAKRKKATAQDISDLKDRYQVKEGGFTLFITQNEIITEKLQLNTDAFNEFEFESWLGTPFIELEK